MSFSHVLMGLLVPGERHGYDLKRTYDARFPAARPVASAQVYSTLSRLARDGLVAPGAPERAGGPDRTAYALTQDGRTEVERWLAEVEPPSPFVANPLAAKVTIAVLAAARAGGRGAAEQAARSYLRRQRAAHLARMRHYTATKTDPGASFAAVLAADYALEHLDADLRWIETALTRATTLSEEISA